MPAYGRGDVFYGGRVSSTSYDVLYCLLELDSNLGMITMVCLDSLEPGVGTGEEIAQGTYLLSYLDKIGHIDLDFMTQAKEIDTLLQIIHNQIDLDFTSQVIAPRKCECPIFELINLGCKCGGV